MIGGYTAGTILKNMSFSITQSILQKRFELKWIDQGINPGLIFMWKNKFWDIAVITPVDKGHGEDCLVCPAAYFSLAKKLWIDNCSYQPLQEPIDTHTHTSLKSLYCQSKHYARSETSFFWHAIWPRANLS